MPPKVFNFLTFVNDGVTMEVVVVDAPETGASDVAEGASVDISG